MTTNDITGTCAAVRELIMTAAGADLPEAEKRVIQTLCEAGLRLLESTLIDLNRSADALVSLADSLRK